jgi:hypothetical protein
MEGGQSSGNQIDFWGNGGRIGLKSPKIAKYFKKIRYYRHTVLNFMRYLPKNIKKDIYNG